MAFDKRIVKVHIVRNKDPVFEQAVYFLCHLFKPRRISHHLVCNACHGLYIVGNSLPRVDQCGIMLCHLFPVELVNGDLRDPVGGSITARGFYVDDAVEYS